MKLAEALILRSDLQIRMSQLKERLIRSSKVQEGSAPPENPDLLLKELNEISEQLTRLIQKINQTNCHHTIKEHSISDLLAERDVMIQKRKTLASLIESAGALTNRYSRSEIKIESTVNIDQLQKQVDSLSKNIREIDTKIQEANWTVELM